MNQLTTNFNDTQQAVQLQNVLINQLTTNSNETQQTVQLQSVLIGQLKLNSNETQQTVQLQNAQIEQLQGQIDQLTTKSDEDPPLLLYRSCEELILFEPGSGSGGYWIDPDGVAIGDPPIYVQCDMTSGPSRFIHFTDFY